MTDQELERAERIRRLQERRGTAATRSPGSRPAAGPSPRAGAGTVAARPAGRRRKHYNASRIVLAGLSVTSFFSILAAIGLSQPAPPVTSVASPAAVSGSAATPAPTAAAGSATPAKAASPSLAKPVTRSHGS
jgi:hypothetical protein